MSLPEILDKLALEPNEVFVRLVPGPIPAVMPLIVMSFANVEMPVTFKIELMFTIVPLSETFESTNELALENLERVLIVPEPVSIPVAVAEVQEIPAPVEIKI